MQKTCMYQRYVFELFVCQKYVSFLHSSSDITNLNKCHPPEIKQAMAATALPCIMSCKLFAINVLKTRYIFALGCWCSSYWPKMWIDVVLRFVTGRGPHPPLFLCTAAWLHSWHCWVYGMKTVTEGTTTLVSLDMKHITASVNSFS